MCLFQYQIRGINDESGIISGGDDDEAVTIEAVRPDPNTLAELEREVTQLEINYYKHNGTKVKPSPSNN